MQQELYLLHLLYVNITEYALLQLPTHLHVARIFFPLDKGGPLLAVKKVTFFPAVYYFFSRLVRVNYDLSN